MGAFTYNKIILNERQFPELLIYDLEKSIESFSRHKVIVEALLKYKRLSKAEIKVLLKNDSMEDLIQFKKDKLKIALSPVRTKQMCDMEKALI